MAKVPTLSDAYRFGSLLWEVVTRRDPTRDLIDIEAIDGRLYVADLDRYRSMALKNVVKLCWDPDISKRPSIDVLVLCIENLHKPKTENIEWKDLELKKPVI